MDSGIYWGQVFHERRTPKHHQFNYRFMQWCVCLDELDEVNQQSRWLSTRGFAPLWFRRNDYLRGSTGDLKTAVLEKMNQLNSRALSGRIWFVGNLRTFGIYFSPLNLYFLQQGEHFTHVLAEVSNTPWLERHYYLVDLAEAVPEHEKAFHVSPFNPMDMRYRWYIEPPTDKLSVTIKACRERAEFIAGMKLSRSELNRKSIKHVIKTVPFMALRIIGGIYWQALKLFIKRIPIYDHPKTKKSKTR